VINNEDADEHEDDSGEKLPNLVLVLVLLLVLDNPPSVLQALGGHQ